MCTEHVDENKSTSGQIITGLTTKGIEIKCTGSKPRERKTPILKTVSTKTLSISKAENEGGNEKCGKQNRRYFRWNFMELSFS